MLTVFVDGANEPVNPGGHMACAFAAFEGEVSGADGVQLEQIVDECPREPGIYMLENVQTGEFYVGSSVCIHKRVQVHFNRLRRGSHCNSRLQKSWNDHGPGAFHVEIMEYTTRKGTIVIEQEYLDSVVGLPKCFNMGLSAVSGTKGRHLTPEHKAKIGRANSTALKGGKTSYATAEWLSKIRRLSNLKLKGRKLSEAHKLKLSAAKTGKPAPWNRRPKTPEEKAKISATKRWLPWPTTS